MEVKKIKDWIPKNKAGGVSKTFVVIAIVIGFAIGLVVSNLVMPTNMTVKTVTTVISEPAAAFTGFRQTLFFAGDQNPFQEWGNLVFYPPVTFQTGQATNELLLPGSIMGFGMFNENHTIAEIFSSIATTSGGYKVYLMQSDFQHCTLCQPTDHMAGYIPYLVIVNNDCVLTIDGVV